MAARVGGGFVRSVIAAARRFATTARSLQATDRATSVPVRASINGNGNCPMAAEQVDKVKMLTDRISPILHGHNPEIQGAVLAELLATWLAGHAVPGDRMQTILLRGRLFHEHMKIVRESHQAKRHAYQA